MNVDYKMIKSEVKFQMGSIKHLTNKAIDMVVEAMRSGEWAAVYASDLYNLNGSAYCGLLESLNYHYKAQLFDKVVTV